MDNAFSFRQHRLIQPIIFLIGLLLYCINPIFVPQLQSTSKITDFIPMIPEDKQTLWTLGYLSAKGTSESLEKASKLVEYNFTSHDELTLFHEALGKNSTSLISTIWNYMSFVNIMIVFGIVGMIVTFFPAFHIFLGPLLHFCSNICTFLLTHPPILEALCYSTCFGIIMYSMHLPKLYGIYAALVGSAGFTLALSAFVLHSVFTRGSSRITNFDHQTNRIAFYALVAIVHTILAIYYNSKLMGFAAVFSVYSILGFCIEIGQSYYTIGFDNENTLVRSTLASVLFVVLTFTTRNITQIEPFLTPIYVFGPIVYYLGLLILSSKSSNNYGTMQMYMIISLIGTLFVGSIYQLQSIVNVSITYAVLYILEKVTEMSLWKNQMALSIFACSLMMYKIGMYLHSHPEFIMSLVDPTK
jgi:hypothetical protein